jgi:predicted Fe-S protein YdhL (DUF1289 family)
VRVKYLRWCPCCILVVLVDESNLCVGCTSSTYEVDKDSWYGKIAEVKDQEVRLGINR